MEIIRILIVLSSLFILSFSYLQFSLVRIPKEKYLQYTSNLQCLNSVPNEEDNDDNNDDDEDSQDQDGDEEVQDQNNFKQICYQKDISYAIQLYNKDDQKFLISMDTTIPFSWLKGNKCHIGQNHKKCSKANPTFKSKIQKFISSKSTSKSKKDKDDNEYALIKGSTQVVKGIKQKMQDLTFWTRDIGRLARMKDIFLIGLGVIDQNHEIQLKETNFINATRISQNLNKLCDGAVSLRFDENSQSSFLKEMIATSQASNRQKYVTIYTGENSSIMIGDISVKHSRQGLGGIVWLQTKENKEYGRLPYTSGVMFTVPETDIKHQVTFNLPVVFTISSSSIHIPQKQIQKVIDKLFKKQKCSINETTRYVECEKVDKSIELNFKFQQTYIGIPIKDLILSQEKKKIRLNIKKALDSGFVVLGEPIFKRYLIILDYNTNKIGVSLQSQKPFQQVINVVTLLHFVVWTLIIMCCVILVTNPWQRCKKVLSEKPIGMHMQYAYPHYRIKKKYSPLDQEIQEEKKSQQLQ